MAIVQRKNGAFGIYNEAGYQVEASFTAGSTGLNPKELLESSLGLCTTIVIQRMLERDGIELDENDPFSVEVKTVKAADRPSRFEECIVQVSLPDHLPEDYKNKLIKSAEKACTIGNTLKQGLKITQSGDCPLPS
ncbi:hypothetical protein J14TS2_27760 [Bacillus sp. J14TS2]|uniref:OsmC family protein n=1 Tax=Bacillus sp. J14TS2 TaxID=2807188 RepID=UPI001B2CEEDE|nr:OsmC family protein [Bacillus sp. J14TS2]GIN72301.1 hypothetical protein J14TS2_27760 [Bacillus sp. J14TS2]